MFKNILIPLDGTPVAAAALPYAEAVATRTGARLILVRAAHLQHPLADAADQQRVIAEAEDYLLVHAQELAAHGFEVDTGVPFGGAAANWIVEETDLRRADLVVMATHDRIGPDRWVHGSVAEVVVGRSPVPVLLVGPTQGAQLAERLTSQQPVLVVPLDGSQLAEAALPWAREFAARLGGQLVLVGVVPGYGALLAAQGGALTDGGDDCASLQASTQTYLNGIASQLTADGLSVAVSVRCGIPAQQIAATAREHGAAAVVMASHGRTGMVRRILGSVAGQTLHHSPCPVLLIRPAKLQPLEEPVPSYARAMPLIVA